MPIINGRGEMHSQNTSCNQAPIQKNFGWLQEFTVVSVRQKCDFKGGVASLNLCQQEPVGDSNAPM